MGSAIECFPNAAAVVVPGSRFSPVKTCPTSLPFGASVQPRRL